MFNMILCLDKNDGLGKDNKLLYHFKDDMDRFLYLTKGSAVIMGAKTLESLPGSKPLPNRHNVVITHRMSSMADKYAGYNNISFASNVSALIHTHLNTTDTTLWVIGGSSIYRLFEYYCTFMYLTRVDYAKESDVQFHPSVYWSRIRFGDNEDNACHTEDGISYQFMTYINTRRLKEDA